MKHDLHKPAISGPVIGVVFGIVGDTFSEPVLQRIVHLISSLGPTTVLALTREQ